MFGINSVKSHTSITFVMFLASKCGTLFSFCSIYGIPFKFPPQKEIIGIGLSQLAKSSKSFNYPTPYKDQIFNAVLIISKTRVGHYLNDKPNTNSIILNLFSLFKK